MTGVIVHQLLSVLIVMAIVIQTEVRHLMTGVGSCCTSTSQCANGQGDCDSDGGKGLSDWSYCTSTSECANGQGDCDSDGGKGSSDWSYCTSTSQ